METHLQFRKASSEETSAQDLSELSKTNDALILCAVASNKSTNETTILALKESKVPEVIDCLRKRGII